MRIKARFFLTGLLILASLSVIMLSGCGNELGTPPLGSSITTNPTEIKASIAFDTCFHSAAVVAFSDGTPMNEAILVIDGAFAFPRMGGGSRYTFYDGWGCTDPTKIRNSGFRVETDVTGAYKYSVLVSAATGTFTDTINIYAGYLYGSQKITIE